MTWLLYYLVAVVVGTPLVIALFIAAGGGLRK